MKYPLDLGGKPMQGFGDAKRVRIVHRGGVVEVFRVPVTAGQVMGRYPRFCVTTPDVFRSPWDAVVKEDAALTPGCKFFLVPMRSVKKLQSRQCGGGGSYASFCNSSDFATNSVRLEPATSESKTASANTSEMDEARGPKRSGAHLYNTSGAAATGSLNYNIRSDGSSVFCAKMFYSNHSNFRRQEHSRADPAGNNYCNDTSKGGKSSASDREFNRARGELRTYPPQKFNRMCRGLAWYPKLGVIPELSP